MYTGVFVDRFDPTPDGWIEKSEFQKNAVLFVSTHFFGSGTRLFFLRVSFIFILPPKTTKTRIKKMELTRFVSGIPPSDDAFEEDPSDVLFVVRTAQRGTTTFRPSRLLPLLTQRDDVLVKAYDLQWLLLLILVVLCIVVGFVLNAVLHIHVADSGADTAYNLWADPWPATGESWRQHLINGSSAPWLPLDADAWLALQRLSLPAFPEVPLAVGLRCTPHELGASLLDWWMLRKPDPLWDHIADAHVAILSRSTDLESAQIATHATFVFLLWKYFFGDTHVFPWNTVEIDGGDFWSNWQRMRQQWDTTNPPHLARDWLYRIGGERVDARAWNDSTRIDLTQTMQDRLATPSNRSTQDAYAHLFAFVRDVQLTLVSRADVWLMESRAFDVARNQTTLTWTSFLRQHVPYMDALVISMYPRMTVENALAWCHPL